MGAAVADDTPGTISYAQPAAARAATSLLTREKVEGQPPFRRTTGLPCTDSAAACPAQMPGTATGLGDEEPAAQAWDQVADGRCCIPVGTVTQAVCLCPVA